MHSSAPPAFEVSGAATSPRRAPARSALSHVRTTPCDPPSPVAMCFAYPAAAPQPSPPETPRTRSSVDTDNPFTETFATPPLRSETSLDNLDDAAHLSAFDHEDPQCGGGAGASQPWRIPPAIARKQSQTLLGKEGSPLRWSYSSAGRVERAPLDRNDTFNPTRRRLSVSSVSLDSLNARATPRHEAAQQSQQQQAQACGSPGDSGSIALSQLAGRVLSSSQALRLARQDASTVDPYVN